MARAVGFVPDDVPPDSLAGLSEVDGAPGYGAGVGVGDGLLGLAPASTGVESTPQSNHATMNTTALRRQRDELRRPTSAMDPGPHRP